jgi:hypothetical protein
MTLVKSTPLACLFESALFIVSLHRVSPYPDTIIHKRSQESGDQPTLPAIVVEVVHQQQFSAEGVWAVRCGQQSRENRGG